MEMVKLWITFGFLLCGCLSEEVDPLNRHINTGYDLYRKASKLLRQGPAQVRQVAEPEAFVHVHAPKSIRPNLVQTASPSFTRRIDRTDKMDIFSSAEYELVNPQTYYPKSREQPKKVPHVDNQLKLARLRKTEELAEFRPAEHSEKFRKTDVYAQDPKKQVAEPVPPRPQPPPPPLDFTYHNYTVMTEFLHKISNAYPHLARLYSIGKSVQGRELWVVLLTTNVLRENIGRPNAKIVGNIHGNEGVGREVSLHMIEYLLVKYTTEPYVKWLLDHTKIHILPSLNPDGFEVSREGACYGGQGRYNAMGFDLNRNFPDYFKTNVKQPQPETEAYKQWLAQENFVLSASLHGGALVVSYPFDNTPNTVSHPFVASASQTPDNDVVHYLANSYASTHPTMHLGLPCKPGSPTFPNGTVNGASWYPLIGGAQDYNYVWGGCLEITVEMSCCKYPPSAELPVHWEDHRSALLQFLGEARRGVRGLIVDAENVPIPSVEMRISGRGVAFKSSTKGEYWRVLLPGQYTLEAYKEGYEPSELSFTVLETQPTILNIMLRRIKRAVPVLNSIDVNRRLSSAPLQPILRKPISRGSSEESEEVSERPLSRLTKTLVSLFGR